MQVGGLTLPMVVVGGPLRYVVAGGGFKLPC
jgi:hypothetical protein